MEEKLRDGLLEEKLGRMKKALQQLEKDKKIEGFRRSGSLRFARRMGIDFYAVYIDGKKYVARPLWIVKDGEEIKNKRAAIRVSLYEGEMSLGTKILETIRHL